MCPGMITQNPVYYGFIAGTSSISIQIPTWNCTTGDGLQAAVVDPSLDGCESPGSIIACYLGAAGTAGSTLELTSSSFVPGQTYFLMIDGWWGDQCNYAIAVTSGSTSAALPASLPAPVGPSVVCPGSEAVYSTPEVGTAGFYHWTAPVGASINGQGNNVVLDRSENGNEVTITFSTAGGQVCVAAGNSCFPQTPFACKNVSNTPLAPTVLPAINIPVSQTPYTWSFNGQVYTEPGSYAASQTYLSSIGCDSTVKQQLNIVPSSDGYTSGVVFWDADADGVFDAGEQVYTGGAVVSTASGMFVTSDGSGKYVFQNLPPGDVISVQPPLPGLIVKPVSLTKQSGVWTNYNFGLSPVPTDYDLSVNFNATGFRPGFNSLLSVTCRNTGPAIAQNVVANAQIPFNILDPLQILPANANASISGNNLSWNVGALAPGASVTLNIWVKVPANAALGAIYDFSASVGPIDHDHFTPNNYDSRKYAVLGSFDPNDKQAIPAALTPAQIADEQPIEYTIRFQNTGSLPADFVKISDLLENTLDPGSFRFVSSSHPCGWKIDGNGALEFFFDMIHLPDSMSSQASSHGYVRFTVKARQGLPIGTEIRNKCNIFFDYNSEVTTNTSLVKVIGFGPGGGLPFKDALKVRPNPAAFRAFCDWQTPAPADGRIRVFDLSGQLKVVVQISAGDTTAQFDVQNLPEGLYFVVLESGNVVLVSKVTVVHPGGLGN